MPRTNIDAKATLGSYPVLPIPAGDATFAETAISDPTDRDVALVGGKTLVMARNTDSVARTITFTSAEDSRNRTGNISTYSIDAGANAFFGPFHDEGWSTAGRLLIDVSDAKVRLTVLTLP